MPTLKTVLVTGIGGPTPRSIAKTLRIDRPDLRIVGVDCNRKALGFFMPGLVDAHRVAPRVTEPGYWDFMERLVREERIDAAIVQPETEVIAWGERLRGGESLPCPTLIPPVELSRALVNKARMAEALAGTEFIPRTITVTQEEPRPDDVASEIGFPCWIRATQGSGGLGALKIEDLVSYRTWLFINRGIREFTVSSFLPGRHLANQMLYFEGEYIKGASLECVEYIMASIAPSRVTGNTSYGRFINDDSLLDFCDDCIQYLCRKLGVRAHGVLSFDLKEDSEKNPKVTEVNVRHMAYTGVMAHVGFDLIEDTLSILSDGNAAGVSRAPHFQYEANPAFLRDVDIEPIVVDDTAVA